MIEVGGLRGPDNASAVDSYVATEPTPEDTVNAIYEAIAPQQIYWMPGNLTIGPVSGGAAAQDMPPNLELEREDSAVSRDSITPAVAAFFANFPNLADRDPKSMAGNVRGGPRPGWRAGVSDNIAKAPRIHNMNNIFNLARAIGLKEGDVKRALAKSDIEGDMELNLAKEKIFA